MPEPESRVADSFDAIRQRMLDIRRDKLSDRLCPVTSQPLSRCLLSPARCLTCEYRDLWKGPG